MSCQSNSTAVCRVVHYIETEAPGLYLIQFVPDFSPDSDQNTFSLEKELLWTRFRVKNILMLDLSQLLSSPDVN